MNLIMKRYKFILFLILIFFVSSKFCKRIKRIVGGIEAEKPPEDDPVVFIDENNRNSRIYGVRDPDKGFYVFKGIRFGEAPVGRHRFQRPRAVHLDGEYNATTWGPPCPQDNNGHTIGSEDCLFLNVFTPALPDSGDGYPVLIWIHGGGFRFGAACQYEMRNLIKQKMVVVSIQYRLGSLGFLSTGTNDLPGNNGMFDMILATNWVKKYIKYFGGNPNKTVAFGHGSGASAALMLSLSKLTNNYFSGLIAMSGSMLSSFVIDKTPMLTAKHIASNHDCPTDNVREMIRCLQELPISSLIDEDSKFAKIKTAASGFISGISTLLGPGPVIEGSDDLRSLPNFMTDTPENFLSLGKFPEIPLLTGIMKDETGGAIFGDYKDEITKNLKSIPNYLNKKLITSLQDKITNFGNKSRQFVPDAFNKYLGIGEKNNNALTSLKKISETLNDAIFNTPAFLTANYWSKKAETFFYSFDYNNNQRSYGKLFLNGLPIVNSRNPKSDNLGHGDDLGYVFRANDIFGKKIPTTSESPDEENVVETFTSMIAEFARTGKPKITGTTKSSSKFIPTFSKNDSSFISITNKATSMKNFRFCEIGLWIGDIERLNSASCSILKVTTETVERIQTGIVDIVSSPVDTVENIGEKIIPKIIPNISIGKEIENSSNPIKNTVTKIIPKIPNFGFLSP